MQSMSGGGAERGGDTELEAGSRLRAVSTEPDPGLKPTSRGDRDLSRSQTFNPLSHPGAPKACSLLTKEETTALRKTCCSILDFSSSTRMLPALGPYTGGSVLSESKNPCPLQGLLARLGTKLSRDRLTGENKTR